MCRIIKHPRSMRIHSGLQASKRCCDCCSGNSTNLLLKVRVQIIYIGSPFGDCVCKNLGV